MSFNFTTNKHIVIENLRCAFSSATGIANIWYNPQKINGAPTVSAANGWINLGTSPSFAGMSPASASPVVQTIPVNLNLDMLPQDTFGFFIQWTGNVYPTTNTAIPTFSDGTVTIIADATSAYTGTGTTPSFNPRQINGGVIYRLGILPCAGAPDAGQIEASALNFCPGYPFTLVDTTHTRDTGVTGITWAWEISSDNVVWGPLAGSNMEDTITGIFSTSTYYRLKVTCATGPTVSYSNVVYLAANDPIKCYCYSTSLGGDTDTSDIGVFTIGDFSVNIGGPHVGNPLAHAMRTDYTAQPPIELWIDSTYELNIKQIMPGLEHKSAKVTLFMDYNNNLKYDQLEHERVYTGFTSVNQFLLNPLITISDSAIMNKPTGMRLIINNDLGPSAASDSACGTYVSGETEDFMVIFRQAFLAGIATPASMQRLSVYPNPATGIFRVEFTAPETIKQLDVNVTNITGQVVAQSTHQNVRHSFTEHIDLSGRAKGIYFIELVADGQRTVKKLTLQ